MKVVEPTTGLLMHKMSNAKFAPDGLLAKREILFSDLGKRGNQVILTIGKNICVIYMQQIIMQICANNAR